MKKRIYGVKRNGEREKRKFVCEMGRSTREKGDITKRWMKKSIIFTQYYKPRRDKDRERMRERKERSDKIKKKLE